MWKFALIVMTAAALAFACTSGEQTETAGQTGTQTSASADLAPGNVDPANYELDGQTVTLAGLAFTPPADWTDLGPSGMRKASYYWGPAGSDTDSATVTVFYFGPTGGGSIDANLDRWVGQMALEGADAPPPSNRYDTEVNGMPLHVVTAAGAYAGSMGPMGGSPGGKEGYYMIGAVVEGPEGNVFFKLTGPEATAKEMGDDFLAMIKSIDKV